MGIFLFFVGIGSGGIYTVSVGSNIENFPSKYRGIVCFQKLNLKLF